MDIKEISEERVVEEIVVIEEVVEKDRGPSYQKIGSTRTWRPKTRGGLSLTGFFIISR